ncbi:carbohydrate ABC transporter ATP-binding protein, CUT1 family [Pseudorhodobacter antarcticus]|uniref:Carbohydrate ABC transporter ATP-binding protein, CUT1 family n=1 Tax=Pseudorhodobacter antarcticus TaxID=1077947 RepID=A0A1H8L6B9_9RHOB|nr:ABC transporter ATP-binding protein [Pseudorhodobacter antarcticus]SEO00238.1 carbohydrate ABC transporter ATP-binding protein, CUT1 family [Pseudorhodobacter antarcticus]
MPILSLNALNKSWGATHVVRDLSLETREGEFIALLGPSGCGKSTTLRLIAGLEDPTGGQILLDGRDIATLPSAQRGISMVFQSYALFPHLTVGQNITFGLSVRGESKKAQAEKLARVAPQIGLEKLLDRRPSQLSGGQQQRVALGRALIAEAPICLLDEPLSNLDASLRAEMRSEIRSLQRRLGITMIFVTHDQTEAMSMADRVALLRDGRLEQFDTPEALYSRPASTFVAGFIGAPPMNLLAVADLGAQGAHLPKGVQAGLRPEDITLGTDGLPGRVESVEYFGADSILSVDIGGPRVAVRLQGRPAFGPDDTVNLGWPADALHLFDATTGMRRETTAPHLTSTETQTA